MVFSPDKGAVYTWPLNSVVVLNREVISSDNGSSLPALTYTAVSLISMTSGNSPTLSLVLMNSLYAPPLPGSMVTVISGYAALNLLTISFIDVFAPSSPSAKIKVSSVGADTMDSVVAAVAALSVVVVVVAAAALLSVLSSVLPQPASIVDAIAVTRTLAINFFLIIITIPFYRLQTLGRRHKYVAVPVGLPLL